MYDRVGGLDFFISLVDRFYEGVSVDPVLRPLYPDDLVGPKEHLALFLAQYWGGPRTYTTSGATRAFGCGTHRSSSARSSATLGCGI